MGEVFLSFEKNNQDFSKEAESLAYYILGRTATGDGTIPLFLFDKTSTLFGDTFKILEAALCLIQGYFRYRQDNDFLPKTPTFQCKNGKIYYEGVPEEFNRESFIRGFHKFTETPGLLELLAQSAYNYMLTDSPTSPDTSKGGFNEKFFRSFLTQSPFSPCPWSSVYTRSPEAKITTDSIEDQELNTALKMMSLQHKTPIGIAV